MHSLNLRHKLSILKNTLIPILKDKPYMSHLWITRHCNIHCKFCYIRDYTSVDPTLDELEKRLDKIRELGCRVTVIMGGEPTLRKDLPEIVKACKTRDIISYLVTNGTLLTKSLMDKLGKAKLDLLSISLDTLSPKDTKLINYGKFAYEPKEKLKLMKYLQDKYNVFCFVALCITKMNYDEILPIVELAKEYNLGITITAMANPYILPNIEDKSWKPEKDKIVFRTRPEIEKLGKLMKILRKKKDEGYRIIDPYAYFDRTINLLEKKGKNPCKAGSNFFDINTDGKIMLCVMSEPIDMHYSELNKGNFIKKLKPFRDKQLRHCSDNCMLAAYYDTSYYGDHLIEYLDMMRKNG